MIITGSLCSFAQCQVHTVHGLLIAKCLKGSLSIEVVKLWDGAEDRWDIFPLSLVFKLFFYLYYFCVYNSPKILLFTITTTAWFTMFCFDFNYSVEFK